MQIHVHTISFSTLLSQVWFGPNDILHGTQSSFASESLVHFPIKLYVPKAVLELLEHVTCKCAGYDYYTIGIDLEI